MILTMAERIRNIVTLLDRRFIGPHEDGGLCGHSMVGLLFALTCDRAKEDDRLQVVEAFEQWIGNGFESEFPAGSIYELYAAATGGQPPMAADITIKPVGFDGAA